MKNAKKVLVLVLCAVLLVGASVAGTVAYLTSRATVTNTFTVGKVEITMDEANVNEMGEKVDDTRVQSNTYKLIPGHTYIKDPIIHVDADSENCFLFVEVNNGIANLEEEVTIAKQMENNGWLPVDGETNVYYYQYVSGAGQNVAVFQQFKVRGDVLDLSGFDAVNITVEAYAVQQDGFASAQAAWDATFGA